MLCALALLTYFLFHERSSKKKGMHLFKKEMKLNTLLHQW